MKRLPIVALVGRQNVGKSTIFNRMIKQKKAIIDSTPGVTRDVVYGEIEVNGLKALLYDTGGISDDYDQTNKMVQKKRREAQDRADLILFIVEAGVPHPQEKEFLYNLMKKNKKIILIMNKADTPDKDIFVNDFYDYGLGEAISVSASHNRNFESLDDIIFNELKDKTFNEEQNDMDHNIKIAIIGKPNVGKSSLLNQFSKKERSIVSNIPGTTRDVVDEVITFKDKRLLVLDTAGIRKKTKVTENLEYYSVKRALNSIKDCDVVYLVIDSMENITDQDKKIANQIVKEGKGLLLLLNKWDLQKDEKIILKNKIDSISFKFPVINYVPIIPVSAITGMGLKNVLKKTLTVYEELHKRIDTATINDFIQTIIKQYAPSSKKGVLKIYYGTQTSTAPVEFIFFINKISLLSNNYSQYITNKIREHFGYKGIPITVHFKDKR